MNVAEGSLSCWSQEVKLQRASVFARQACGNAWLTRTVFAGRLLHTLVFLLVFPYVVSLTMHDCCAAPTARANPQRLRHTPVPISAVRVRQLSAHLCEICQKGNKGATNLHPSSIANIARHTAHLRCTGGNLSGYCVASGLPHPTRAPAWRKLRRKNPHFLRALPAFDRTIALCNRR